MAAKDSDDVPGTETETDVGLEAPHPDLVDQPREPPRRAGGEAEKDHGRKRRHDLAPC